MIAEREVHNDVRDLLMGNDPFQYAYLIKFERPSRPDSLSGRISTSAQRYVYLTDGSRDVEFDDLSRDLDGNLNGTQVYTANKVLNLTAIQESVKAKADTATITLDGNGLGGAVSAIINIISVDSKTWDLELPEHIELINEGFREGDKISLSGAREGSFNIEKFRDYNSIRITKIDDNLEVGTGLSITISLDSEEIKSILMNKNSDSYASFINREVFIYRAYFKDGKLVGEEPDSKGATGPLLLFRGIISNVSFEDDESGIKVQWGLTSHWGDFAQVRGRITSDEFHRALDENGIPQPDSAIKTIYAYDKGFAHADTSINLLATYTVMVDKTTIKSKNGFFGIGAKTKVKTVAVPEGRTSALDFQLQAKSIPVLYGVRSTSGTPVFADTLKSNSSEVYVLYTLAEGEIGGIYDLYIEGKSLICNDADDFDTRHTQNSDNTIDLVCRGRADRGDVLGGVASAIGDPVNYYYDPENDIDLRDVWNLTFNRGALAYYQPYVQPSPEDSQEADYIGKGVIHGETITLTAPQEITIDVFSGTEAQKAASQLVDIARAGNFKVQSDYWRGNDTAEYWGPNHRLIDTAYVVAKFKIKEGETTIPDIEFVVRGKVLDCFNYDYSYAHDEKETGESPNNFQLGDTVTLSTGQIVQIIDKWRFARPDGVVETRFRFSEAPDLEYENGIPAITRFNMQKGGSIWTMTTFNWIMHSGQVAEELSEPGVVTPTGPGVVITFPNNPNFPGGGLDRYNPNIFTVLDGEDRFRDTLISGNVDQVSITADMFNA